MSAAHDHSHDFDGASPGYRARLWIVIASNAAMFWVEMTAGHVARSQTLQADALDFFADAATDGISLAVLTSSLRVRVNAALVKGLSLLAMGLWIAASTLWMVRRGGVPEASVMGWIGAWRSRRT